MRIPRRTFVHTLHGAAMAALVGRSTAAQPRLTVIDVPGLALTPGATIMLAGNASASVSCEVQIHDGDRPVAEVKWGLFANRTDIDRRSSFDGPERRAPRPYRVKIALPADISIAVALVQETGNRAAGVGVGMMPGAMAAPGRTARFVQDPAKDPGHFLVSLPSDCTVALNIWPGATASGTPLHTREFKHVAKGAQGIPWNLQRDAGGRAPGGRYTALLVCTPHDPGFLPSNLASYFAVSP